MRLGRITQKGRMALCLLWSLVWAGISLARAEDWPDFPYPEDAQLLVVGDQLMINGVPMQILEMTVREDPDTVLEFYRQSWEAPAIPDAPGYSEADIGGWKLISRIEEPYLFTVQVGEYTMGTTVALLSLSTLPKARLDYEPGRGFPTLGGTEFLSDLVSEDPGKSARTLQFKNGFSVKANYEFYRKRFERDGWRLLTEKTVGPSEAVLMMAYGNRELNMTFNHSAGETYMVSVETK